MHLFKRHAGERKWIESLPARSSTGEEHDNKSRHTSKYIFTSYFCGEPRMSRELSLRNRKSTYSGSSASGVTKPDGHKRAEGFEKIRKGNRGMLKSIQEPTQQEIAPKFVRLEIVTTHEYNNLYNKERTRPFHRDRA